MHKIKDVVGSAINDVKAYIGTELKHLTGKIDKKAVDKYSKNEELTVEQIQDIVEDVLMDYDHKVAKEYILYRQERKDNRENWLTDELPLDIFERKYQFEGESFEEFFERVAGGNETMKKHIKNKEFLPAGRILANRGLFKEGIKVTYSNCYVIEPPKDSIESIFDTSKELARTFSYGGGAGIDISKLRPKGARVNNASKYTTGSTSFMPLYSITTGIIGQKGRRGALMISIDIDHPDIEDFINIKNELGNVEKANISVKVTDEFIRAIRNNLEIALTFKVEDTGEYICKNVDANKLMNMIAYGNWNTGEPGFLYWDEIEDYSLLSNDDNFEYAGVNPCVIGDTLVETTEGKKKISELVGKKPMVYTMGIDDKLSLAKATRVWKTRENAQLVKVKTHKGDITCTPDHKIFTTTRGWIAAKDLGCGDKVKGLNRSMISNKYCGVGLSGEGYEKEHRFLAKHYADINGKDVHHINGNSLDNRLSNIQVLEHGEHSSVSNLGHEDWSERDADSGRFIEKETTKERDSLNLSKSTGSNWFVKEIIYLEETADVYDMTVPGAHNFVANEMVIHNCAEEPLPAGGSCLLGHINLAELVEKPFTDESHININKLQDLAKEGIVFLNQILDEGLPLHPLDQQKETVEEYRQIGMGIMGLADMFIKLGIEYGSQRSIELIDSIGYIISNKGLQQSALLAMQNGTYPAYDDSVVETDYFNTVANEHIRDLVYQYGLRNSQLLTIAPTGSTSTMLNVSGGIEPLYQLAYERTTKTLHEKEKTYTVYPDIVEEFMEVKGIDDTDNLPDYFVSAFDLTPKQRIDVQAQFQKYIDASISSTINLPNSATVNDIKELYLYGAEKNLKGLTVFRNGCKRAGILSDGEEDDKKVEMNDIDFLEQGICPECKTELNQSEGCTSCPSCGYSACSV